MAGGPFSFPMSTQQKQLPTINPIFCQYRLKIRRSPVHRFGVFAADRIPRGRKVIEYKGQRISRRAIIKRARRMSRAARMKLIYFARIDPYWMLDGAVGGSGAQYINHSCEPNVRAWRSLEHIVLFSRRTIQKGEELTWDYRYSKKSEPVSCRCGSPKCRGTINLK
jgi:SET domain-containing protein